MNKTDRFLIQQAEVLLDEFFDMAGDADTKRLMKIGEWWRLVHIARFYSDDVNLSDEELFVLREGEKFWYVSQGAPILSESRIKDIEIAIKADWPEIHLALGFCSCIRIISHLADPIESAVLFRIACESRIFIIMANDDQRNDERKQFASLGGKARIANDPRQAEKAFVKDCWLEWQKKPGSYTGQAEFARDMLTKCENLKSQPAIENWCRVWKKA